ncbi:hypothetical protein P4530_21470 [Bacillus thuringiensis]|nr:hypothetical protein [Bacillus thuringiensis]
MNYPFENLVFEGGGIKGIGYVGALEYLETVKIYYQALKGLEICLQEQLQLLFHCSSCKYIVLNYFLAMWKKINEFGSDQQLILASPR